MANKENMQVGAGAIYARISHIKDDDQTGVERQERICRETAARLGIEVPDHLVFVDPSRSAWQRNRKRKGWDALLEAIKTGQVGHVLAYHPDRLMRQPKDLEELLQLADEHKLMLHGQANRRDLSNSDDRFFLRIEVAHACKSSDDTSRRVLDAQLDQVAAGKAHGGRRTYGYAPDMSSVVEGEAAIVKESFTRFLKNKSIHKIAVDLNARNIPTATGKVWSAGRVRQMLDCPRYARLIVFKDEIQTDETGAYRVGNWEEIISVGMWEEAHRLRRQRSAEFELAKEGFRPYLLRGLVICGDCGRAMVGNRVKGYPIYVCTRPTSNTPDRCKRRIGAEKLERFIADAAKKTLTEMTVAQLTPSTPARTRIMAGVEEDHTRLAELKAEWINKKLPTDDYIEMRTAVAKRIAVAERATVVRPVTAVEGLVTGPGAGAWFDGLELDRQNAALKFLFSAVRIGPHTGKSGTFDLGRIDPEPRRINL